MAITRVQSAVGNTGSSAVATTFSIVLGNTTTGNLLVVATSANISASSITTISSTANVTWVNTCKANATSSVNLFFGYILTGETTPTITVNVTNAGAGAGVCAEYSGILYPVIERTISAAGSSTTPATGNAVAATAGGGLWVTAISQRATNASIISGLYTTPIPSSAPATAIVADTSTNINTSNADRNVVLLERIMTSSGTLSGGVSNGPNSAWVAFATAIYSNPATAGSSQKSYVFG